MDPHVCRYRKVGLKRLDNKKSWTVKFKLLPRSAPPHSQSTFLFLQTSGLLLLLLSRFSRDPIELQPTRLRHPWDSPGKNTGVGCHFLLQCKHACWVTAVVSDSVRPYGQQPTRLLSPQDSLGKNTGVGCHFLLLSSLNFLSECSYSLLNFFIIAILLFFKIRSQYSMPLSSVTGELTFFLWYHISLIFHSVWGYAPLLLLLK